MTDGSELVRSAGDGGGTKETWLLGLGVVRGHAGLQMQHLVLHVAQKKSFTVFIRLLVVQIGSCLRGCQHIVLPVPIQVRLLQPENGSCDAPDASDVARCWGRKFPAPTVIGGKARFERASKRQYLGPTKGGCAAELPCLK